MLHNWGYQMQAQLGLLDVAVIVYGVVLVHAAVVATAKSGVAKVRKMRLQSPVTFRDPFVAASAPAPVEPPKAEPHA